MRSADPNPSDRGRPFSTERRHILDTNSTVDTTVSKVTTTENGPTNDDIDAIIAGHGLAPSFKPDLTGSDGSLKERKHNCAYRMVAHALGISYDEAVTKIMETGHKLGIRVRGLGYGVPNKVSQHILMENDYKLLNLSKSPRSHRRIAPFDVDHLPHGVCVVYTRGHCAYVEDGVPRDTWASSSRRRNVLALFVPKASDFTVKKFWDNADRIREEKYGRVWNAADYDDYYEKRHGRRPYVADAAVTPNL